MAQLNDLIVNGNTRFLNSAYGNLVGSASTALYAPTNPHDHNYQISGNNSGFSLSAGGVSISGVGNISVITSAAKTIKIDTKSTISANLSANSITSTTLTSTSANGSSAIFTNFSGTNINIGTNNTSTNAITFGKGLTQQEPISNTYSDYSRGVWIGSYNAAGDNDKIILGVANGIQDTGATQNHKNNLFAVKGNSNVWIRSLDNEWSIKYGSDSANTYSAKRISDAPTSNCLVFANQGVLNGSRHAVFYNNSNYDYDYISKILVASAENSNESINSLSSKSAASASNETFNFSNKFKIQYINSAQTTIFGSEKLNTENIKYNSAYYPMIFGYGNWDPASDTSHYHERFVFAAGDPSGAFTGNECTGAFGRNLMTIKGAGKVWIRSLDYTFSENGKKYQSSDLYDLIGNSNNGTPILISNSGVISGNTSLYLQSDGKLHCTATNCSPTISNGVLIFS